MASSCGTDADKSSLRSNYLMARRGIPARTRLQSDISIMSALMAFPIFSEAPLVLTYVSRAAEVGTQELIEELLSQGRRVAVPRVDRTDRSMTFHEIASLGELAPGAMRILEPSADAPALTEPAQLAGSVCLVPGLVFDGAGHRVGYGGGYYDRFLAFYPGDKIGLARTTMLSSNPLPTDGHDVPVDFIATEGGVWSCRGR
ncbi:MAG TPA: 5-formyltetrahydrofolate cyclo-ligase [Candidatus Olsenella pullistercoris]|uniref:5-formyltetrahydrofolate cyclo-ligase n=1 Tax=Candidatus Olsenella pullistercoris TaxID=2838712 RepID=A0A9D2EYZ1_9ACTN|nr:5-formyltetrahydrofolate cyclo-ligase [Candidatus Olsenella pullistercoris]